MARLPLIPARGERLPPSALRGIGLLLQTARDVTDVGAALEGVGAVDWVRTSATREMHGWVQREVDLWPRIAMGVINGGWVDPTIRAQRDLGGWLVVRVGPIVGRPGSRIETQGEVDGALEEVLLDALQQLGVRLLRRWDPTGAGMARAQRRRIPPEIRRRPRVRRS